MNFQFADPRSTAQDIPDIYWEQAARELDFCTCRKCQVCVHFVLFFPLIFLSQFSQARYRQYFENEDPVSPVSTDSMGETIIPMETQVMREASGLSKVKLLYFIFRFWCKRFSRTVWPSVAWCNLNAKSIHSTKSLVILLNIRNPTVQTV